MLLWLLSIMLIVGFGLARISDHPVRLVRLRLNLTQAGLAERAGVQRSAVTAVEDGRTRVPSDAILGVLAAGEGRSVEDLKAEVAAWFDRPVKRSVRPAVERLLEVPPYLLSQYYGSFVDWRREVAPSATAFASLLRVNAAVVSRYESGGYKRGMPEVLSRRLVEAFGLDVEYVLALEGLPVNG